MFKDGRHMWGIMRELKNPSKPSEGYKTSVADPNKYGTFGTENNIGHPDILDGFWFIKGKRK